MSQSARRFGLGENIRYRSFGEEGVVLRQDQAEVMVLNETGIRVLRMAADGAGADDIVQEMSVEYNVDRVVLKAEIEHFLDELVNGGILVERQGGS